MVAERMLKLNDLYIILPYLLSLSLSIICFLPLSIFPSILQAWVEYQYNKTDKKDSKEDMPDHFKGTSLKFGKWHSEVIVGTLIYKGGTSSIFIIPSGMRIFSGNIPVFLRSAGIPTKDARSLKYSSIISFIFLRYRHRINIFFSF